MYILGINAAYHESAACLMKDGEILVAIEEERLNRIKHGKQAKPDTAKHLPWKAIKACLSYAKISPSDCEHIGYSFNPDILQNGVDAWRHSNLSDFTWEIDKDSYQTKEGGLSFLQGITSAQIRLKEAGFSGSFHFLSHHACHAASAFHVSPFDKAAVLVVDGIGEWASTTLYHGEGVKLTKIREYQFPNSLGFVWEKLSKYLGFSHYDASKVMGLSAYGKADKTIELFKKILPDADNLIVDISLLRHESPDFSELEKLFGLPKRDTPLDIGESSWQDYVHVAAGLQCLTEMVFARLVKSFDTAQYRNLCLAGGVALNCAANGYIARQCLFDDIFVQPAANDAGTALGATCLIWNQILGKPRCYTFENVYLGPEFSDDEIKGILDLTNLSYKKVDIVKETARLIADGNIIGWFNGRMEWGPRALGNRSLLADPSNEKIREIINAKVKHRELYRPFCPSILAEKASDWLEIDGDYMLNQFMLCTSYIRRDRARVVPAIVHEDGTVRAQVVSRKCNPKYHALISEFESLTGIPLLLNTSFNDSEPIVCTPQDAINTFMKTRIDYLVLGNYLVSKPH